MASTDAGEVARERLPGHPASAGTARRTIRAAIGAAVPAEVVEAAELLVSEVVTNAVVHAATDITLVVTVLPEGRVRVEVSDGSRHAPSRRDYEPTATTGHGLRLLEELADRCGTVRSSTGKTVWFEVTSDRTGLYSSASAGAIGGDDSPEDAVPVALLGVPLALYATWREQADAILRDYLLATLDENGSEDQVARHAACSAALSLVLENVPTDCDTEGSRTVDVVVPVPIEGVVGFRTLDETLDQAITKADEGSLLAPATDAAVRELRRWICREVRQQVAGELPTPWKER